MNEFRSPKFVSLNFHKDILAKDIMTREVVSVSPSDSILEAYQRLAQSGFSGLPVVEGGLVVGLLTSHDIIAKGGNIDTPALVSRLIEQRLTGEGDTGRLELGELLVSVSKVMNPEPVLVREDATLSDVFETFNGNSEANPIPVVNADGELVGIISRSDVLKFVGDMLAAPIHLGGVPSENRGHEGKTGREHAPEKQSRMKPNTA